MCEYIFKKLYLMPRKFGTYFNVKREHTESILVLISMPNHECLSEMNSSAVYLDKGFLYCPVLFKLYFTETKESDSALHFTE